MGRLTNKRLIFSILAFSWTANGFTQTTYDSQLVSTDKELNFAFTDKRGIKARDGVIYYVEKGKVLIAFNTDGKVKWMAEVLKTCPKPAVGTPEICYIKLTTDKIQIVFGKHDFASVDIIDGKVICLGAD
jgi:hypothetical protein